MMLDPEAPDDLLTKKEREPLTRFILGLPDATDDEKRAVRVTAASPDEADWVPFLSLMVIRIFLRRAKILEEHFLRSVIDASADALVNAISEGDQAKAERSAEVAFVVAAELLEKSEGTED